MPKRMLEGYIASVADSCIRFQSESWLEKELSCGDVSIEHKTLIHTFLLTHRFTAKQHQTATITYCHINLLVFTDLGIFTGNSIGKSLRFAEKIIVKFNFRLQ